MPALSAATSGAVPAKPPMPWTTESAFPYAAATLPASAPQWSAVSRGSFLEEARGGLHLDADEFGQKFRGLIQQQLRARLGAQRGGAQGSARGADHLERLRAYGACRAEYRDAFHSANHTPSMGPQREHGVNDRRAEEHAVEPVHHAPVAGENIAVVLDAGIPLDRRGEQVADLADRAAREAEREQFQERRARGEKALQEEREQASRHAADEAAHAARDGFVRAQLRAKLAPAQGDADEIREGVPRQGHRESGDQPEPARGEASLLRDEHQSNVERGRIDQQRQPQQRILRGAPGIEYALAANESAHASHSNNSARDPRSLYTAQ